MISVMSQNTITEIVLITYFYDDNNDKIISSDKYKHVLL